MLFFYIYKVNERLNRSILFGLIGLYAWVLVPTSCAATRSPYQGNPTAFTPLIPLIKAAEKKGVPENYSSQQETKSTKSEAKKRKESMGVGQGYLILACTDIYARGGRKKLEKKGSFSSIDFLFPYHNFW